MTFLYRPLRDPGAAVRTGGKGLCGMVSGQIMLFRQLTFNLRDFLIQVTFSANDLNQL
jgi:hypothetical protein